MSTLTNATNATGRNFVFSKGYTIQGVPKNALSELPFVKPGLRVKGLPLPVGCFPGSARPSNPVLKNGNSESAFLWDTL